MCVRWDETEYDGIMKTIKNLWTFRSRSKTAGRSRFACVVLTRFVCRKVMLLLWRRHTGRRGHYLFLSACVIRTVFFSKNQIKRNFSLFSLKNQIKVQFTQLSLFSLCLAGESCVSSRESVSERASSKTNRLSNYSFFPNSADTHTRPASALSLCRPTLWKENPV